MKNWLEKYGKDLLIVFILTIIVAVVQGLLITWPVSS